MQQSRIDLRRELEAAGLARVPPQRLLLVTDFDGTLSEVVSSPSAAEINAASENALRRLAGVLGRVAILSSRSPSDLEARLHIDGIELIGDSGLQDMTSDERRRLEMFNVEAARVLAEVPGVWLEIKPGGTAIHHRHAALPAEDIVAAIGRAVRETELHVRTGRRVIEVSPRERPKGDALAALVKRVDCAGVICLGDDENDRPMFEYVSGLSMPHLTVGVASGEAPPDLFDGCELVVSGPDEVGELLAELADLTQGRG
ncbi:MAG TPA: trehalose-phosphatase [Candidatus Dormibacteraeota bacterium]|nr:trehalose-phosphatase [Candidatus Dormibacteraeota bacterium]